MMRVGRITTVYEIPSDNRGKTNQNLSESTISFSDILKEQYNKVNTQETPATEQVAKTSSLDNFETQNNGLTNNLLGLYNSSARIYVDGIIGTMQYHNIIIPDHLNDTDDYDSIEGVYRSNKG